MEQSRAGDSYVLRNFDDAGRLDWGEGGGRVFYLGDIDGDGLYDVATQGEGATAIAARSSLALRTDLNAGAVNDALTFVDFPGQDIALFNGALHRYDQIPGLRSGDAIKGVNNSMLIVGSASDGLFIVRGGVRTLLVDAIVRIDAPLGLTPNYGIVVQVGDDGTVLLRSNQFPFSPPGNEDNWLFKDGVLTYLWKGEVFNVNDGGDVLGKDGLRSILRSADGTQRVIDQARFSPGYLADDGAIAGILFDVGTSAGRVAVLRAGTLTARPEIVRIPPPWYGGRVGYYTTYALRAVGMSRAGDVLVEVVVYSSPFGLEGQPAVTFVSFASGGLRRFADIAFGVGINKGDPFPVANEYYVPTRFVDGDRLLTGINGSAVFSPADASVWSSVGGVSSAEGVSGGIVVTLNRLGDMLLFEREAGVWTGYRVRIADEVRSMLAEGSVQFLAFPDGLEKSIKAVVITPSGMIQVAEVLDHDVYRQWAAVRLSAPGNVAPIVANGAVFVGPAGRPHVVGTDSQGHLCVVFEVQPSAPTWNWSFATWAGSDLTKDHLQAAGKTFVPVAGGMTAFATRWGGMNAAYLDAAGHVQTVWWAPGLPLWTIDDLSTNAGSQSALHGTLVSYVTPWGGLNVAGTDPDGNLVALWWAPGLKKWRTDRLVGGTPAPLDESTITGFATPWGGLNVVGLNKVTGKLTAYWWAPGKTNWIVEEFTITNAPADLALKGRVSSAVSPDGRMFIGALNDQGHVANIHIGADTGLTWVYEDVTALV